MHRRLEEAMIDCGGDPSVMPRAPLFLKNSLV
jgi:hypothetical protein